MKECYLGYQPYLKQLIPHFPLKDLAEKIPRTEEEIKVLARNAANIISREANMRVPVGIWRTARMLRILVIQRDPALESEGVTGTLPGNDGRYWFTRLQPAPGYTPEERATVAHETGHIVLHDYFDLPVGEREVFCEIFAAAILAPEDFLKYECQKMGNLEPLKRFHKLYQKTLMPPDMLAMRLVDLDLLPFPVIIFPLHPALRERIGQCWIYFRGETNRWYLTEDDPEITKLCAKLFPAKGESWEERLGVINENQIYGLEETDENSRTSLFEVKIQSMVMGFSNQPDCVVTLFEKGEKLARAIEPDYIDPHLVRDAIDITGWQFA